MVSDAEQTSTTAAAFLPEIWSTDTQDAVEFNTVMAQTVTTKFESDMAVGRILHIPHVSNFTTQTKSEGVSNTTVFEAVNLVAAYRVAA